MNILGPSWRPKLIAILGAIVLIVKQFIFVFDDDPATKFDLDTVLDALYGLAIVLGFFVVRDQKVSDQKAGARPEPRP